MPYESTDYMIRVTVQHPKGKPPARAQVFRQLQDRLWGYDGGAEQGGTDLNFVRGVVLDEPGRLVDVYLDFHGNGTGAAFQRVKDDRGDAVRFQPNGEPPHHRPDWLRGTDGRWAYGPFMVVAEDITP